MLVEISGEAERYYWNEPWLDVILLGADSLETLRSMHANWYRTGILPKRLTCLDLQACQRCVQNEKTNPSRFGGWAKGQGINLGPFVLLRVISRHHVSCVRHV